MRLKEFQIRSLQFFQLPTDITKSFQQGLREI